ncbi:MAG: hypothetical protein WDN10_05005 [bacterium]
MQDQPHFGIVIAICAGIAALAVLFYVWNAGQPENPLIPPLSPEATSTDGVASTTSEVPVYAPEPAADPVHAYGSVTISLGQVARFADLYISPLSIEEDSRCPKGVQCIQAGTVRVQLEIGSGLGKSTQVTKLGDSVTTEAETITFVAANPEPVAGITVAPADYRFTFTVTKRPPAAAGGPCFVGGCSSQICSDEPGAISTCEYRDAYACYKTARCERQPGGQCGWTQTPELAACLASS